MDYLASDYLQDLFEVINLSRHKKNLLKSKVSKKITSIPDLKEFLRQNNTDLMKIINHKNGKIHREIKTRKEISCLLLE